MSLKPKGHDIRGSVLSLKSHPLPPLLLQKEKGSKIFGKARCKAMDKYKRLALKWALFELNTHWNITMKGVCPRIPKVNHYCLE